MGVGAFLQKTFKNQEVELLVDHDLEWVHYAEASILNAMIIHGVFIDYDEECKIITMQNLHDEKIFYIAEEFVQMFWKPGFKITESLRAMINTGQKLFKGDKGRDIF